MSKEQRLESLLLWAAVATIVLASFIAIASGKLAGQKYDVALESYKASLQLIVVVVLGTALKLGGDSYLANRNKRAAARELRKSAFVELLKAYNQIKHSRRLLRARGFAQPSRKCWPALRDFYNQQMIVISEAELALEQVWKHAKAGSGPFSQATNVQLKQCVDSMTDYLDLLIKEYEQTMPLVWARGDSDPWPEMEILQDFVGAFKTPRYAQMFSDPFYQFRDRLRDEMSEGHKE